MAGGYGGGGGHSWVRLWMGNKDKHWGYFVFKLVPTSKMSPFKQNVQMNYKGNDYGDRECKNGKIFSLFLVFFYGVWGGGDIAGSAFG